MKSLHMAIARQPEKNNTMRAPKVYVVSVLVAIFTLLAAGYPQTSNPRPGPEASTSQDASPKPSSSVGHTATGAVPDSANNPRQAVPSDSQHLGHFGGQKWSPASPSADDLNSPLAITASVPESPATVPQFVLFEFLFGNISLLNQVADQDDKTGKHTSAAQWRTHDQRGAGLNDAEGQILQEIALDCLRALKGQDTKINTFADEFRAQLPPGAPIQAPAELVQMVEDRKAIVRDHIEKLKQALGDTTFNKLDAYVRASFHGEVILPKPAPHSTVTEKTKESR